MKRLQYLLVFALGIFAACSGSQSTVRAETPTELVTLEAGVDGLCHVHSQQVDRKAPCAEIAALMRAELHIPVQEHVALRVSKGVRYEEISALLQSLKRAGYPVKIGSVNYRD